MSAAKRRLHRLLSHRLASLAVAAVLAGGCLAFASSQWQDADSSALDLSADTAWLVSTGPGIISEVSASAGSPDTSLAIAAIAGHSVTVTQDATTVLVGDEDTGVVHLIDASSFTEDRPLLLGLGNSSVIRDGSAVYGLDPAAGLISYAASLTSPEVKRITLGTPIGNAEAASDGTLWVAEPRSGAVIPVRDGVTGRPVRVGHGGDDLTVATAGDAVAVIDGTSGQATVLSSARPQSQPRLLTLPPGLPRAGLGDLVPSRPETGPAAVFAAPALRSLIVIDTADLRVTTVRVASGQLADAYFSPPLAMGGDIYVGDGSGRLLVYGTGGVLLHAFRVSPTPASLDIFSLDGLIWANDPTGPDALVIVNGTARIIHKYQPVTKAAPAASPPTSLRSAHTPTPRPTPTTATTSAEPAATQPRRAPGAASATATGPGTAAPTPALGSSGSPAPVPTLTTVAPTTAPTTAPAAPVPTVTAPVLPAPTTPAAPAPTTAPPASASPPSQAPESSDCGSNIKKDFTLRQDISCSTFDAFFIDANKVTLDLGGNALTCTDSGTESGCVTDGTFEGNGLYNFTNFTLKNGTIVAYGTAVYLFSAHTVHLENLDITGAGAGCLIFLSGVQDVSITNSTITNCQIAIDQSDNVRVTGDTLVNSPVRTTDSRDVVVTGNQG